MTTAHRGPASLDLSSLSVDQLRDLKARVDVELQLRGGDKSADDGLLTSIQFYDASRFALREYGVVFRPYGRIKKRFDALAEHPLTVASSLQPKTRIQAVFACKVVARAIIEDIRHRTLTITSNTYLSSMSRAGYAIDRQFPNYRSSGLLHALLEGVVCS